MHWRKKSRISWLKDGERNTTFFKITNFQRRGYKKISKLKKKNGQLTKDENDIKEEITSLYKTLLSKDQN